MTLFLQWWWSYPETKLMDIEFFTSLDSSKKLLYIPTAMVGWFSYEECHQYIANIIQSLWLSIELATYPYLNDLKDTDFNEYSWIYIWWWNTFKLLYEIKKYWIDYKIRNFLKNWWKVCWWSAGAIIFWENINTAPDANIVWLKDVEWLKMAKGTSIWCHYKEEEEAEIKEYILHHNMDVIALYETTWLIIENDKIKTIGEWKVIYYSSSNKKTYDVNQIIE